MRRAVCCGWKSPGTSGAAEWAPAAVAAVVVVVNATIGPPRRSLSVRGWRFHGWSCPPRPVSARTITTRELLVSITGQQRKESESDIIEALADFRRPG